MVDNFVSIKFSAESLFHYNPVQAPFRVFLVLRWTLAAGDFVLFRRSLSGFWEPLKLISAFCGTKRIVVSELLARGEPVDLFTAIPAYTRYPSMPLVFIVALNAAKVVLMFVKAAFVLLYCFLAGLALRYDQS